MDVTIIAVGTELLFGQTINTNAAYLSKNLNNMGFNVMYHHVVGDNPSRLRSMIESSLDQTDIIVLTGGLGPTQDDLTKETVAEVFGMDMYLDEECLEYIRDFFESRGRKMSENNIKQAYNPVGSTVFLNESGTAPAVAIEKDGKYAICLPGPPREMKWVFEHFVSDYLHDLMDKKMYYRIIRTIGIGESDMEMVLMPLIDGQTDPTIATYAKEGECSFRVASQRDTKEEAEAATWDMIHRIEELIGDYIYSYDDEELHTVVVNKLIDRHITLTAAESCTGGLFAKRITDVPGASAVFERGFVTYSEDAKVEMLGVNSDTISKYSVVSPEVALEMAICAREKSGADIAVAVTGYAGPEADPGRDCGEAFIAYVYGDKEGVFRSFTNRNDRRWNRNTFVLGMLDIINRLVDGRIDNERDFFSLKPVCQK